MIRKHAVSLIFTIALTLALLMGLLFTPVTGVRYSDGIAVPTATPGESTNSGSSGGGNTGG